MAGQHGDGGESVEQHIPFLPLLPEHICSGSQLLAGHPGAAAAATRPSTKDATLHQ